MKEVALSLFLFCFSYVFEENPSVNATTIIITKTIPYCGGAAPSEEMIKASQEKIIPYGTFFYLIKGSINKEDRKVVSKFQIDSTGRACLNLRAGTYSIINEFSFQKLRLDSGKYDNNCLRNLWATPLISFQVQKNNCDTVRYNIAENCAYNQPCGNKLDVDLPMEAFRQ